MVHSILRYVRYRVLTSQKQINCFLLNRSSIALHMLTPCQGSKGVYQKSVAEVVPGIEPGFPEDRNISESDVITATLYNHFRRDFLTICIIIFAFFSTNFIRSRMYVSSVVLEYSVVHVTLTGAFQSFPQGPGFVKCNKTGIVAKKYD